MSGTSAHENLKFGWRQHGIPVEPVTEPKTKVNLGFDDLPPIQQMLRIGVSHGCPNPIRVAVEIGLDISQSKGIHILEAIEQAQKWLIERQLECNKEWNNILRMAKELNPPLHVLLIKPEPRKPNEPVGEYNPRLVSKDYKRIMPPGSAPWGYEVARIKIEQMGRGRTRTSARVERSDELTREAILQSSTPVDLIVNLACLVVTKKYGGKGNAGVMAVLSQTLAETSRNEQGCTSIFSEIATKLKERSPKMWNMYSKLSVKKASKYDIVHSSVLNI